MSTKRYAVAALMGGVGGALGVVLFTRAIPNMMSEMMSKMPDP